MGPKPPEKLKKVAPRLVRDKVNEIIKYAVAIHIQDLKFLQKENEVIETPNGLLIKIQK